MKKARKILSILSSVVIAATSLSSFSSVFADYIKDVDLTRDDITGKYAINNDEYIAKIDSVYDGILPDDFIDVLSCPVDRAYATSYEGDRLYLLREYFEQLEHRTSEEDDGLVQSWYCVSTEANYVNLNELECGNGYITEDDVRAFLDENDISAKITSFTKTSFPVTHVTLEYTDETLEEKMDIAVKLHEKFDYELMLTYDNSVTEKRQVYYDNNMTYNDIDQIVYPNKHIITSPKKPVTEYDIDNAAYRELIDSFGDKIPYNDELCAVLNKNRYNKIVAIYNVRSDNRMVNTS